MLLRCLLLAYGGDGCARGLIAALGHPGVRDAVVRGQQRGAVQPDTEGRTYDGGNEAEQRDM